MSDNVFSPSEKEAILKAAEGAVINHPMGTLDIIRVIDLIGDAYSLGYDIEALFEKAGIEIYTTKSVFLKQKKTKESK